MKIIKRYSNRKLYDTEDSRYVTLQDLIKYVQKDMAFQVVDNVTKTDITRATLCAIWYTFDLMPADLVALKTPIRQISTENLKRASNAIL